MAEAITLSESEKGQEPASSIGTVAYLDSLQHLQAIGQHRVDVVLGLLLTRRFDCLQRVDREVVLSHRNLLDTTQHHVDVAAGRAAEQLTAPSVLLRREGVIEQGQEGFLL